MTKNALRLSLAAAILSACSAMTGWVPDGKPHPIQVQAPAQRQASYCHLQNCVATVTVDANCVATVDPYALVIGGTRPPVTIVWKVSGRDAAFADGKGIVFDAAGAGVFTKLQGASQTYVFQDGGARGVYHYFVNVTQGGRPCPTLDPTDINDM